MSFWCAGWWKYIALVLRQLWPSSSSTLTSRGTSSSSENDSDDTDDDMFASPGWQPGICCPGMVPPSTPPNRNIVSMSGCGCPQFNCLLSASWYTLAAVSSDRTFLWCAGCRRYMARALRQLSSVSSTLPPSSRDTSFSSDNDCDDNDDDGGGGDNNVLIGPCWVPGACCSWMETASWFPSMTIQSASGHRCPQPGPIVRPSALLPAMSTPPSNSWCASPYISVDTKAALWRTASSSSRNMAQVGKTASRITSYRACGVKKCYDENTRGYLHTIIRLRTFWSCAVMLEYSLQIVDELLFILKMLLLHQNYAVT